MKRLIILVIFLVSAVLPVFSLQCTDECTTVANVCYCPAKTIWLPEKEPILVRVGTMTHEVELVDVTVSSDSCGIRVDNTTVWIDEDDDEEINNVRINVFEAVTVHAEPKTSDNCRVFIAGVLILPLDVDIIEDQNITEVNKTDEVIEPEIEEPELIMVPEVEPEPVKEEPVVEEKSLWQRIKSCLFVFFSE